MQRTSRRLRQVLALAAAAALLAVGSALATVDPTVRVSPTASPFGGTASGAACQAQTQTGTNYPGAEVEPFVDVNLTNARQPRGRLAAGPLVERRLDRPDERLLE